MAIPQTIKELANKVRTSVFGKDVRESLAKSMEETANVADETKIRQESLETQFQDVLDETTGKDVISAPEILAARGEHANLKQRLDEEHNKVMTDLAQNTNEYKANASMPIFVSTYDNSGQSTHPHVEYFPNGFLGYKYWMVMTPYTLTNDQTENPSLRASNDGFSWMKINGIPDPLVNTPIDGFNSDPYFLVKDQSMYVFYRTTTPRRGDNRVTKVYYITSTDAKTWSSPVEVPIPTTLSVLSPSFMYENGTWKCWWVEQSDKKMKLSTSTDLINWITIDLTHDLINHTPWHLEVNKYDKYEMLLCAYPNGMTEASVRLLFLTSNNGINWNVEYTEKPVMKPNPYGWDNRTIYKSSFIKDGNGYKVWYGGNKIGKAPSQDEWYIGYSAGKEMNQLLGLAVSSVLPKEYSHEGKVVMTTTDGTDPVLFFVGTGKHIAGKFGLRIDTGTDKVHFNYGNGVKKGAAFYNGGTTPLVEVDDDGRIRAYRGIGVSGDFTTDKMKATGFLDIESGDVIRVNYNNNSVRGIAFYGGGTTQLAFIGGLGEARFKNIGVDNAVNASSLGTVVKKMEVFDKNGVSLGFIPIYNSIN